MRYLALSTAKWLGYIVAYVIITALILVAIGVIIAVKPVSWISLAAGPAVTIGLCFHLFFRQAYGPHSRNIIYLLIAVCLLWTAIEAGFNTLYHVHHNDAVVWLSIPAATIALIAAGTMVGDWIGPAVEKVAVPRLDAFGAIGPFLKPMIPPVSGFFAVYFLVLILFGGLYKAIQTLIHSPSPFIAVTPGAKPDFSLWEFLLFSTGTILPGSTSAPTDIKSTTPWVQTLIAIETLAGVVFIIVIFAAILAYLAPHFNKAVKGMRKSARSEHRRGTELPLKTLFAKRDLDRYIRAMSGYAESTVNHFDEDKLKNGSLDGLTAEVMQRLGLHPMALQDTPTVRPFEVKETLFGQKYKLMTFEVPMCGSLDLLSYAPPGITAFKNIFCFFKKSILSHVSLYDSSLYFIYRMQEPPDKDEIEENFRKDVAIVTGWVERINHRIEHIAPSLPEKVREYIAKRQNELRQDQELHRELMARIGTMLQTAPRDNDSSTVNR